MAEKVIDLVTLNADTQNVIRRIASNSTRLNDLTAMFDRDKEALKTVCEDLFKEDFKGSNPELASTMKFQVEDKVINVVFKMKTSSYKTFKAGDIDISAKDVITAAFGEQISKVFQEVFEYEITASQETLSQQHKEHPELVGASLKNLPAEVMEQLIEQHPECFNYHVLNEEVYSAVYSEDAKKVTLMKTKASFIDKASKLEKTLLKKGRNILKKVFDKTLNLSVTVGNRIGG